MTCDEIADRDIAVEYVLDRLPADERDEYERHYFDCAACYEALEAVRAVRVALDKPSSAVAEPRTDRWRWLAIAAVVLLGVGAALTLGPRAFRAAPETVASGRPSATDVPPATPRPSAATPDMAVVDRLARVEPLPYMPPRLRGTERETFDAAMRRYQAGDYTGAVPLLERAVREQPGDDASRFYLGLSLLLNGDPGAAVASLTPVAARDGSAYAEESRFFLAKAFLRQRDVVSAAAALDRTIALHGDREREAREMRQALAGAMSR